MTVFSFIQVYRHLIGTGNTFDCLIVKYGCAILISSLASIMLPFEGVGTFVL
jgi:hypothetical protein